ncbi:type II toxin-antitoxin system RelE/ParE family toxin [Streptococcus didelphis]|uniref:Type II toxin-antitoxin system RelE/ParE family toxin n=1 Tax=Streptococcus didelphis TaxID=102886 RepID=A0ABY9LFN8_9STRE|nr:type II toxin-antitoxin system RelE/ParE family toxin [Streptococcus didelphis]WMB27714.1 type II toxin-antitoxin system RelE/ParE family toxin [Streptococcus didelphis]WMB29822.1 type II toxin-antitoxin system RelE/ParE family toxin [Streptococcus didelphis]
MIYKVSISQKAEADLDAIYKYYSREYSESSTKKIMIELQTKIDYLSLFPEAYTDFEGRIGEKYFSNAYLRMIPTKNYLIFYIIQEKAVTVLRIVGTRTDYLNHLDQLFKRADKS